MINVIYFDNAATTFPKPIQVVSAMNIAMKEYCANPGRSGHDMALKSLEKVYECREHVAKLFGMSNPENVVFTKNATEGINYVIKGMAQKGKNIVISSFEHNSVARPAYALSKEGVKVKVARVYPQDDEMTLKSFKLAIDDETCLVCALHVSNVFGNVLPAARIGKLCKGRNIPFMLDASQSAGVLPVDMIKDHISFLCAPGHKSLYGPQGTGILLINSDIKLKTITEGGTGSTSSDLAQPDFLPDALESGTLNVGGICGLCEGVKFIEKKGQNEISRYESSLCRYMVSNLSTMKNIMLYLPSIQERSLFSFNVKGMDCGEVATMLNREKIAVRSGLHCSPMAHTSMGTLNMGTVRVSLSAFNKKTECEKFCDVIYKLQKSK